MRFFQVGTIALFIASLFDIPKREIKDFKIPILLLLGLVIVNSFWHRFQPLDIRAVEDLFFGVLAFVIVTKYLADPKDCIKYILIALGINLMILTLQRIGWCPTISLPHYIPDDIELEGGMLGNITKFCVYLAIILPFISLPIALVLAFVFGIYMHYSQISVLIPVALMMFYRFKNKIHRYLLVCCMSITAIFLYKKIAASILLRWNDIWKLTIDRIFEKPLLGWGLGNYQLWISKESFCSYLPFIYGLGLLGAVWVGYAIWWFIKRFDASKEAIAVAGLLLVSSIEYSFEIPRLWFTIIAVFSFFAIRIIDKKEAT